MKFLSKQLHSRPVVTKHTTVKWSFRELKKSHFESQNTNGGEGSFKPSFDLSRPPMFSFSDLNNYLSLILLLATPRKLVRSI